MTYIDRCYYLVDPPNSQRVVAGPFVTRGEAMNAATREYGWWLDVAIYRDGKLIEVGA